MHTFHVKIIDGTEFDTEAHCWDCVGFALQKKYRIEEIVSITLVK
jgi:hypothetical protein